MKTENEILTPRLLIAKDVLCVLIQIDNENKSNPNSFFRASKKILIKESLLFADDLLKYDKEPIEDFETIWNKK